MLFSNTIAISSQPFKFNGWNIGSGAVYTRIELPVNVVDLHGLVAVIFGKNWSLVAGGRQEVVVYSYVYVSGGG